MKNKFKIGKQIYFISTAAVIYLLGLLFLKYNLNNLTLTEFRIDYIGNILNILITISVLGGFLKLNFGNKNLSSNKTNFLLGLQIISILTLVMIVLVIKFNLIHRGGFVFGFPARKVYMGFLFISGSFLQLFSAVYIWGFIFGSDMLLLLRTVVRSVIAVIILIALSLLFVWNLKDYSEQKILNSKFNYGFVPGAAVYSRGKPSPIFEARLREAYNLYQKGIIKTIILTGSNAPGEISESEAGLIYLSKLNVPIKAIIVENRSTTTSEQIKYLRTELFNVKDSNTILTVSDGFHLSRIMQISKFFKLKTIGVASEYTLSFEKTIFYRTRESVALLLFWLFAV